MKVHLRHSESFNFLYISCKICQNGTVIFLMKKMQFKILLFIIVLLETLAKYKALQEEMEKYKHDLDEARSIIEELQKQLSETTVSKISITPLS